MSAVFEADFPEVEIDGRNIAPATLKIVSLALADHANDEGKSIYPSVDRLARMTGLSDRSVQRAEHALVKLGILRRKGFSQYGTNEYEMIPSALYQIRGGESSANRGESSSKISAPDSPDPSFNPSVKESNTDKVITAMLSIGMFPNSNTGELLETWRKKHTDEWIIKALEKSRGKNQAYADKILLGWEATGYPKTRDEQIADRRAQVKQPERRGPAIRSLD